MSRCWLCQSPEAKEFLPATFAGQITSDDFKISDSHYGRTARLVECTTCGFRYADPLPAADLLQLYADLVDKDYSQGSEGRIRPFRHIISKCLGIRPEARTLLDIGASTGLLCAAAQERGLQPTGVEPSEWAVNVAREQFNLDVLLGTFPHPDLRGQQFDVITLTDVIEHLSDPVSLLKETAEALSPQGLLVITTPDANSLAARIMGHRWWHYRVAHVCFFNRATMATALKQAGLVIEAVETYRWFFELGYVAERLERYVPISGPRRWLAKTAMGRALFSRTVPVNLRDSLTYYAKKPVDISTSTLPSDC